MWQHVFYAHMPYFCRPGHKYWYMIHALYIMQYVKKSISQVKEMSNREKIKTVALAVVRLHLSEGIRQVVVAKYNLF